MRKKSLVFVIIILVLALVAVITIRLQNGDDSTPSPDNSGAPGISEPTPEPTPAPTPAPTFGPAPEGYFKDALFIGDSRTVGIQMVGGLKDATFFSTVGLSVIGSRSTYADVSGYGSVTLPTLLQSAQFGKVYIMLGINDIGGDLATVANRYSELLDTVRQSQPNAIIYIMANLHVTAAQDAKGSTVNNANIDTFNGYIKEFADDETIFYLDSNVKFDDETGKLGSEFSPDGIHFYGDGYSAWAEWIEQNVIVK
ncbi:MAG: GDSL-type esterase/lipase family protein [Oscillospiraceae bacterium]|nr:GDSL-type esterase/lipase family protein [Oscillospiraceae bacterium]